MAPNDYALIVTSHEEIEENLGYIDWRKWHLRDMKLLFKHLKGYLVEE